ncbi:cytochrome P450, partial [Streptomyces sp. NPDC060188]
MTEAPPTHRPPTAQDPTAQVTDPVAFPQDRTCPYHPPAGYQPLREERPLSRISLFDGRAVWVVTGHAAARELLADQRLSSD